MVSNGGGINPESCVQALRAAAKQGGVDLSIAMVTGDDLLPMVSEGVSYHVFQDLVILDGYHQRRWG